MLIDGVVPSIEKVWVNPAIACIDEMVDEIYEGSLIVNMT
jgi:hypothetical protein